MPWKTKPGFTVDAQANLTAQVPDDEDGAIAFAIAEQTSWQLSKTSALPLSANVLATLSGVGRWLRLDYAGAAPPPVANVVDVDLDFGVGPPQETTVLATVPAPWVTPTTLFSFRVLPTSTHTPEDALAENLALHVLDIVPSVSFDLLAAVPHGTNGLYRVRVTGV